MTEVSKSTEIQVLSPDKGFKSGQLATQERSMMETALSREAQIVQASMIMAKQFPRDELAAYQRILRACDRPGLAEAAVYAYPRGGQQVTGPSIRLAEVLAQNWGNLDFGITELEQRPGFESIVMAYCSDLETNTHERKVFTVPHVREKRGGNEILKDPRDIYELVANQGARRLRSCILAIIPGDVVDDALTKCEETMKNKDKSEGPLVERIKKLALAFQKQGVTTAMMEMRLGKKSDVWTEFDYSTLKKIFLAIRDGFSKKEDYFTYEATQEGREAPATAGPTFTGGGEQPPQQKQQRAPRTTKPAAETPPPAPPQPSPVDPAPEPGPFGDPEPELPTAPQPQTPAPAPAPAPAGEETGNPLTIVAHLIKTTSGVDSAEVYRWLHENRVIGKVPDRLADLPEEALSLLVEKWATVTADIRGE